MTITNTVGSSSREQVQGGWDTDNVIYIGSDSSDIEVLPAEPDPVDVDREGLVVSHHTEGTLLTTGQRLGPAIREQRR